MPHKPVPMYRHKSGPNDYLCLSVRLYIYICVYCSHTICIYIYMYIYIRVVTTDWTNSTAVNAGLPKSYVHVWGVAGSRRRL